MCVSVLGTIGEWFVDFPLSLYVSPGEGLVVAASVHAGTGNLSGRSRPERKHCRPRSSSVRTPHLYTGVYCWKVTLFPVFSQPVVVAS